MITMRVRTGFSLPVVLVLACCGGTTNGGGGGGSAGSGGGAGASCPSDVPSSGRQCSLAGSGSGFAFAQCSWGDDPRPRCRTTATCSNGSWSVLQPAADCADTVPLPAACPESPEAAAGACDDPTLACWYDDGTICRCIPCLGGSEYPICQTIDPPEWFCKERDAACPNPMPHAGARCDQSPELSCGPSCELPIRCQEGVWQYGQAVCPICAAPDTPIATPQGERAIAGLAPGDLVYSIDASGIVVVPIFQVGTTPVVNHRVVQVKLTSGTVLEISAGHPTADGRTFADLLAGGQLDPSHAVLSAEMVDYPYTHTYDILPGSSSGTYFAGGALIGSTLAPPTR
jgi:hypothetical protein